MMLIRLIFLFIFVIINNSSCARILGLFPFAGRSDIRTYHTITLELARNGHHVTVFSPFKPDETAQGHDHVHLTFPQGNSPQDFDFWNFKNNTPLMEINGLFQEGQASCRNLLSNNVLKKWIKNKTAQQFDMVLTSSFFNECTGAFAYFYNAHLVQICTFHGINFMYEMMGNPPEYATMPDTLLAFDNSMNLVQRFQNLYYGMVWHALRHWYHLPKMDTIIKNAFGTDYPSVSEIERNTSLLLINSHITQSYSRALLPNIIFVGGLHIKQEKPTLPNDLQKWCDDSKDGIIYFSMGSNLQSALLNQEKINLFLNVFNKLKYRVLWKFEHDSLPGQPSNVRFAKWFPQNHLLAHPNIKLFITHGGLLSTQEAIFHGIPIIGIPIFGDQYINMNRMESAGFGIQLDYNHLTEEKLLQTIYRIQSEKQFHWNAKKLSKLFRDQPETPLKRAIFWIEYTLRNDGAKHLRNSGIDLYWWQRYLLDLYFILLFLLYLCYILFKFFIKLVLSFLFYQKIKKE